MPFLLNFQVSHSNRRRKGTSSLQYIFMTKVWFLFWGGGTFGKYNNSKEDGDSLSKENENPSWCVYKIQYLNG